MIETAKLDPDQDMRVALMCHRKGHLKEAAELYQAILHRDPGRAEVAHLYGLTQVGLGNLARGLESLFLSIRLQPGVVEVEHDLGTALVAAGQADRAIEQFKSVIAADPGHVNAHINLGLALAASDRFEESEAAFVAALEIAPDNAYAWYKLGRTRTPTGDWAGAIEAYEQCLRIDPEHHDARYNLGNIQLGKEQFDVGWVNFEARWVRPQPGPKRPFDVPMWRGESLSGRTILVWGEQGVGEEILFASMIPDLIASAGHVLLECDPRLAPLFARSFAGIETVGRTYPADPRTAGGDIDLQSASGSLAPFMRTRLSDFDAKPYLKADPEKVARIRTRYAAIGRGSKIGISWFSSGNNKAFSAAKSSPLMAWRPVLDRANADFVNLQYGDCSDALAEVEGAFGVPILIDPEIDQMASLDDFAAQIDALDLVVTTSNTTAHVAGALGKDVLVMLPAKTDWRWSRKRDGSLWYPHLTMIRQEPDEGWDAVLERAGVALDNWMERRV
jgi:tetratricopeptide (TPR) repeat protein